LRLAISAIAFILLVLHLWSRQICAIHANRARTVTISPIDPASRPVAVSLPEATKPAIPPDSPASGGRVGPAAGRTNGGEKDRGRQENSRTPENETQLLGTGASNSGSDDDHRESPINCWKTNDPEAKEFRITLDQGTKTNGNASASISPIQDTPNIGQLFQSVDATPLRGKHVEVSADMRTRLAKRRAGLWLRAYDSRGLLVANKQALLIGPKYTISGDIEWTTVDVSLDIPVQARVVSYGVTMGGTGQTWIDNVHVEVSGGGTTVTNAVPPHKPGNLDFESNENSGC